MFNPVPGDGLLSTLRLIFARRAELLRELAELEAGLPDAILAAAAPEPPDEILGLQEAARMLGEPPGTVRQRPEYRKALISRPGERRLRFSRAVLQRIRADRLAARAALG